MQIVVDMSFYLLLSTCKSSLKFYNLFKTCTIHDNTFSNIYKKSDSFHMNNHCCQHAWHFNRSSKLPPFEDRNFRKYLKEESELLCRLFVNNSAKGVDLEGEEDSSLTNVDLVDKCLLTWKQLLKKIINIHQ